MRRWAVIGASLLVLALIPIWAAYGALAPGDEEEGGHHGGMEVDTAAFMAKAQAYERKHRLEDGSVMAVPDRPIPIAAFQWGFVPSRLKMKTGEHYEFQFVSIDVSHSFSLHMGRSSMTVLLTPGTMVTKKLMPARPGEYLFLCNQYCGIAHSAMKGRFIVEGKPVFQHDLERERSEEEKDHQEGEDGHDGDESMDMDVDGSNGGH